MSAEWDDEHDEFEISDELEDQWIAEWDEADRAAVDVLCNALRQYRAQPPPEDELTEAAASVRRRLREGHGPLDWVRQAAGISKGATPDDDAELLIHLASATISPQEETGLDVEEESLLDGFLDHRPALAAAGAHRSRPAPDRTRTVGASAGTRAGVGR